MAPLKFQQVCLNGHQITTDYEGTPSLRKDYCDKCGESTIHQCPHCHAPIKTTWVPAAGAPARPPNHCESCGKPYPWTKRKQKMAEDPAQHSSPDELHIAWGPVRALLREHFDMAQTKAIVGVAGLNVVALSATAGGRPFRSRSAQLDAADLIFGEMASAHKQKFLTIVCEQILQRGPELEGTLRQDLKRLGWQIEDGQLIPVEVFDVSELKQLPAAAHDDLLNAAIKLRNGDLSGAIGSACAAIDSVTGAIYREKNLGAPEDARSFQQRVKKAYKAKNASGALASELADLGWDTADIKDLRHNLDGAINQATHVMESLRPKMGDVHGSKPVLEGLVYDSIKWAALIVRLLA